MNDKNYPEYLDEKKFRKLSPEEEIKYIVYYNKDLTAFNKFFYSELQKVKRTSKKHTRASVNVFGRKAIRTSKKLDNK